jgi:pimeloyl-ACP methyl ester carboxylesterase
MIRVITVDGLDVGYCDVGTGPPVVLLHGYVGDGEATWHPQLRALGDEFRLIAWDAPGAGASADPPEELGVAGYADCVAGFVAALGLSRPHLVGLSLGGAVALAAVARPPPRAPARGVVSGYAGWGGSLPPDVADHRLTQALDLSGRSGDELVDALLPTMFATPPAPADVDRFGASVRAFHPSGFRAMARASAEDLRALLARIDVPTLLVAGDHDVRAPLPVAEHLRAAISGSELVVLPGLGHVVNLEGPEPFNAVLRPWLHRHRAAPAGAM